MVSSAKKSKKFKTNYSKQWEKDFDFVAPCPNCALNYMHKHHYKICKLDISFGAGGIIYIARYFSYPSHISKIKRIKSKNDHLSFYCVIFFRIVYGFICLQKVVIF